MRYHVMAWGSDKYPPFDGFVDEVPADLHWRYPCVNIAMLRPVQLEILKAGLKRED